MVKSKIKNNKGVTLAALVIYMILLIIVLAVLTTITTFFRSNIGNIISPPRYLSEYNKFIMFFAVDVKNYDSATVTSDTIEFENGPTYRFKDNCVFRNDVMVSKNVIGCDFSLSNYTVDTTIKNIITVNMKIGSNDEDSMQKSIDFTMKYW